MLKSVLFLTMSSNQQFCLRWNNHQSTLISVFDALLESGTLVDCTLAAEGQFLKAHKVVLSACSPYLEALLSQHYEKHPILILKDVTFHELKSMLDYMYRGEVNISQEQLGTFLKAAESLQIKGLTDSGGGGGVGDTRDLDRARELDRSRDIERTRELERLTAQKRLEPRKQVPHTPQPRSPLLPHSYGPAVEQRRTSKHPLLHEYGPGSPNILQSREGSISPSLKRKRLRRPSQSDDPNLVPTQNENQQQQQQQTQESKKEVKNLSDVQNPPVSSGTSGGTPTTPVVNTKKQSTPETEQTESEPMKHEVKSEPRGDYSEELQNDDSVEDLTLDEEEEEMDELDLSRPGPSSSGASNSHPAGYTPWHMGSDATEQEMLLAGQQDSQDDKQQKLPFGVEYQLKQKQSPSSALNSSGRNSQIQCPNCDKVYGSPHTLRRHMRLECGKEPQFHCPYCPRKTKQRYNLMLHIARAHKCTDFKVY